MTDDEPFDDRPPTYSLELERTLLGLALESPVQLERARQHLTDPDTFYRPQHALLWRLIVDEYDTGGDTDVATISELALSVTELRRATEQNKLWISDLWAAGQRAASSDAANIARLLVDYHTRRQLEEQLSRLQQQLRAPDADLDALALQYLAAVDDAFRARTEAAATGLEYVSFEELLTKPIAPEQWHAAPILAAGRITLLYAGTGTGKSLIAQEIAVACALGAPILATGPTAPKHVLYVDQEMTPADWLDRLRSFGHDQAAAPFLDQYLHLAQMQAWPPMDTAAGGAALEAAAKACRADIVIVDTVSKVIAGPENENDTHTALYQHTLVPLKRLGCGVLILDHVGKDAEKGARGGSAKVDNVDLAVHLDLRTEDDRRSLFTLRFVKTRFRDDHVVKPASIRRTNDPLTHIVETGVWMTTPDGTKPRPTHNMTRVSRYIEAHPRCTQTDVEENVSPLKAVKVREAISLLAEAQFITIDRGPRGAKLLTSVMPYDEDVDQ